MRLVFLGTGGYHPNERRHTAGLFLPELGIAFDAGSGTFRLPALAAATDLDIFLTHAHLDHIQGLTYLLVPLLLEKIPHCRVHAAPAVIDAVRTHLFADAIFPVEPEFEYVELAPRVELRGAAITHVPLNHPGGCVGFRVDLPGGHSLAYITDTTTDADYGDFIRGVDVLIHECYFSDDLAEWGPKTGHSSTTLVAMKARDSRVGRLYLTHIDPHRPDDDPVDLATARAIFPETYLAEDLLEIEV